MHILNKMVCFEYLKIPSAKMLEENQQNIDCIESEKIEPFWGYYEEYSPERLLLQFKKSKEKVKTWQVIPATQYHNLLKRYMEDPIGSRIPDNIVTDWVMIICKNLAQVISIEKLFGRCSKFPYDAVENYYGIKANEDKKLRLIECMNRLSFSKFYYWAKSPQGNPAWNDWGFMKVYDILKKYREDMDPGDKLILIDRCLNVVHGRGPMAEYFIEGGKNTLDRIFEEKL